MIRNNITINKTARYFLSCPITEEIESIWLVCHGYAQLASYFIRNFDVLNDDKTLVVAPEGLSRFYMSGFSGRVVASWMTSEDRLDEINDYVNYLDAVYAEVLSSFNERKIRINVLGFSQGTATVCRWLTNSGCAVDNIILWAGAVPEDMGEMAYRKLSEKNKIFLVAGDNDQFIKEENISEQEAFLKQKKISYELLRFSGKHEIHSETLRLLSTKIK
jgi:predicted esterase